MPIDFRTFFRVFSTTIFFQLVMVWAALATLVFVSAVLYALSVDFRWAVALDFLELALGLRDGQPLEGAFSMAFGFLGEIYFLMITGIFVAAAINSLNASA